MRIAQKTATYAVLHLVVAFAVAYALTRNWQAALAFGMVEPVFQTIAFSVHERVWARFGAGGGSGRTIAGPEGSAA
jgi:uncharacterized membrane protein